MTARAVWVDEQLARSGIERTGELESVRERPWATILRASTTAGPVWLKAASAATAFEAPLYELLAEVVPDRILTPLGVDVERAWILLPDGGPELGARAEGAELLEALVGVMPQYAGLQRDLAPHAQRMLAAGVNDMRPEVMPNRFEQAIEAARAQLDERSTESERATLERIEGLRDPVCAWSERLAETPAPASIDHNDLHPWNIVAGWTAASTTRASMTGATASSPTHSRACCCRWDSSSARCLNRAPTAARCAASATLISTPSRTWRLTPSSSTRSSSPAGWARSLGR